MRKRRVIFFFLVSYSFLCSLSAESHPEGADLSIPMMQSPEWLLFKSVAVTEPRSADGLLFDQSATGFNVFASCMWDSTQPYWTRFADNFTIPESTIIDSIVWWGGYW